MPVSAEGRVEHQKLNQTAPLGVVWLSFWCSTRFTRKKLDHSGGSCLCNILGFSMVNINCINRRPSCLQVEQIPYNIIGWPYPPPLPPLGVKCNAFDLIVKMNVICLSFRENQCNSLTLDYPITFIVKSIMCFFPEYNIGSKGPSTNYVILFTV